MFMFTPAPFLAEVVARSGMDWVLVDLEHGTSDEADLVSMNQAILAGGSVPLVRVESVGRTRITRALDRGGAGVMVPQIDSASEAAAVVRQTRTQPLGERGVALFTRGMDFGSVGHEGVATVHEDLLTIVQIESPAAVESVGAIAAVDGVDVVFVGPSDLTHALGVPGQLDHPDYDAATSTVAMAARSAGKAAGVLVWNPEDVGRYAAKGYTFFAITSEANTLDRAARTALAAARQAAEAAPIPEVV